MAAGHDANVHDDHGHDAPMQDHPDHDVAVHGGHAPQDDPAGQHDHGHGSHDDSASPGDFWVVPPLLVGLVIGVILIVVFGLSAGAPSFG